MLSINVMNIHAANVRRGFLSGADMGVAMGVRGVVAMSPTLSHTPPSQLDVG